MSNRKKHDPNLADANDVIESGKSVTFEDRRFDYGEARLVGLAPLRDALVAIDASETENHTRIISMRKADRHEQTIHYENRG